MESNGIPLEINGSREFFFGSYRKFVAREGPMAICGDMKRLVDKLNQAIADQDTNQSKLARQTGVAQTTISDILSGKKKNLRIDHVWPIARALGLPLEFLLDDEQEKPGVAMTPEERLLIERLRDDRISVRDAMKRLWKPLAVEYPDPASHPEDHPRSRVKRSGAG